MSLSCDSTDYRHSHEDHRHGPDTEHTEHQHYHDTHDHRRNDGDSLHTSTDVEAPKSQDTEQRASVTAPVVAPTPIRPAFKQISSAESNGRRTPVASRTASFTSRVGTPTQGRPFGSLVNGEYQCRSCGRYLKYVLHIGLSFSPRTPSSSWDFGASPRTAREHLVTPKVVAGSRGDDGEDPDEGSVAGTEFTDVSELTSTGSLTSVD